MNTKLIHLITSFLFLTFIIVGCQKEIDETIEAAPEDVFSSGSDIADLIQKTSLRDGSSDNIIDGSSCSSIELPITVQVNGLEIILDEPEDFETVENIIDKFDDDDDIIEILFPIKVILADHSVISIENEDDLEDIIEGCTEGGLDDDIECIDFKYPLSIAFFNPENQVSDIVTIENDKQMHDFIDDLEDDDIASFTFPLTVILSDDSELTINNHDELEDALKGAINDCDEDDDNDHDEDDVDDSELMEVLLKNEWMITHFYDDKDETSDFNQYAIKFYENGIVKAIKGDDVIEGTWSTNGDDGELELELNFGDDTILEEISDDWDVIEFAMEIIKLKDESGDGTIEYLTLEKYEHKEDPQEGVKKIITNGEWLIANYTDSGEDNTDLYDDYKFNFSLDGNVKATKGDNAFEGTWSVSMNDEILKVTFDFGENPPMDELNDEWDIVSKKENRIELKDISGGDGTVDKLVFELIE